MTQPDIKQNLDFGTALLAGGREGLRNVLIFNAITHVVPAIGNVIGNVAKSIVRRRIEKHITQLSHIASKQRSASIRLFRDYEKEHVSSTLFDAVISHVSELPQTKHVKRTPTGVFIMATEDEIEISQSIFVKKVSEKTLDDKLTQLAIDVFSYEYDLITLRKFVEELETRYNMALANQLGKNIFYFDEIPFSLPLRLDKTPDLAKAPKNLMFSSYVLHTNKSLKNLYGDSVRLIKKRVHFFLNNKRWYEEKGVPYTLGLLLHGVPGAGKTSTIKSIAKDTNRHVLNIKLSPSTTVSQLNNLFYSSQVHVVQNGVNKVYDIPIDKRIIVLEDVDCLTDVVLERAKNDSGKDGNNTNTSSTFTSDILGYATTFSAMDASGASDNEKVTLSTMLNILDGVLEQPGRILIMTSNHPDKLDRALLRPGRIDVTVHFDFCKAHEIKEIVEAFIEKEVPLQDASQFVGGQYTPAEVTQIIFECIEDHTRMFERFSAPKKLSSSDKFTVPNSETQIPNFDISQDVEWISDNAKELIVESNTHQVEEENKEAHLLPTGLSLNDDRWVKLPIAAQQEWVNKQKAIYANRDKIGPDDMEKYLDDFQACDVVAGNSNIQTMTPNESEIQNKNLELDVDDGIDTTVKQFRPYPSYDPADQDSWVKRRKEMNKYLDDFQACGVVAGNSNIEPADLSSFYATLGDMV